MSAVFEPVSQIEQIVYATVRIDTEFGFGTGFLVEKKIDEKTMIPLLITNKHVIYNNDKQHPILAQKGKLVFHLSDENGNPIDEFAPCQFDADFGKSFIQHPNSDVDLCALNLAPFINFQMSIKKNVFVRYVPLTLIPTEEELKQLDYMEDIIMVGYPRAIRDDAHNYPIIRKGVTATHPCIDFDGKKEFLADITNIPGSSGSPVFLLKNHIADKQGNITFGDGLFYFMGIVYATPTCPLWGNIEIIDIPTKLEFINNLAVTTNLAYVIKSSELRMLTDMFQ